MLNIPMAVTPLTCPDYNGPSPQRQCQWRLYCPGL